MEFSGICADVVSQLSDDELRSVLFLLLGVDQDEPFTTRALRYNEIIRDPEVLKQTVLEIYMQNPPILAETLRTIRNFKLLKKLGICKHSSRQCSENIDQFWKALYIICEGIDELELEKLKCLLPGTDYAVCSEQLILILFHKQKISLSDLSVLSSALKKIGKENLFKKVISNLHSDVKNYSLPTPSKDSPCGVAIIINEENFWESGNELKLQRRFGSHLDKDKLQKLWQHFGLHVHCHDDRTAGQIMSIFEEFSKDVPTYCRVFVACLLSHGDKNKIFGCDSKPIRIDSLVNVVANNCPALNNLPKVFVIQACQGQKHHGVAVPSMVSHVLHEEYQTDAVPVNNTPAYADVFQAVATIPGYVSYRSECKGSLFVTEFTKQMELSGHIQDIEQTMKTVKSNLSECNYIQMPLTSSTLRKKLIFKQVV